MTRRKLIVVGNGLAGGRLVEELVARRATEHFDLTVVGEEPIGCYNRILLSKVLGGADPEVIVLRDRNWYETRGVRLLTGVRAERIDTQSRTVLCANSDRLPYDELVLATGSKALVPPTDGLLDRQNGRLRPGAFVFRTVEDCLRVRDWVRPGMTAAVIGGGLLGLEAARGLLDLGCRVTVVHLMDWLMERQLDRTGGDMLRRSLENLGLSLRLGSCTKKVCGVARVEGLWFADGSTLDAELVVFACGIRPRVELAEASGIPVQRAIQVDDGLATSVPGVSALGECAEHRGVVYGIVAPIWDQARALAGRLTGDTTARFTGARLYTRLKVAGIEVASMGPTEPEQPTDEVIQIVEDRRLAYRKLILRDGKLIGAQLVGDAEAAPALLSMLDRGEAVPANRLDLLASVFRTGSSWGRAGADVEVCNCHRVTEAAIASAVRDGCESLAALAERTRAGTGCGTCRGQLAQLIRRHTPKPTAVAV